MSITWQDELAHGSGEIWEPDDEDGLGMEIQAELSVPEPDDEQDRRVSGPTFAEGQQRLAAALDQLTELVRKQTWRQPS